MATDIWPIEWPEGVAPADLELRDRAENYAAATLRTLTLRRVGGRSITVMPCGTGCSHPRFADFHPVLLDTGQYANCWCSTGCGCPGVSGISLKGPVGRIDEVRVAGVVLDPSTYHVEDGHRLIRNDGLGWPSCAGPSFTVTYLNGHPVGKTGRYVGGLLAAEFVKAITNQGKCRLPSNVTNITRQGISYEVRQGMFPDGLTGIKEVDMYITQWNPYGARQQSEVFSLDDCEPRQITWP